MSLLCWKCGAPIESLPQPLARLAACPQCHAELHVCRLCEFYNPRLSDKCDEPLAAGQVREVDRANFCDYFRPREDAFQPGSSGDADAARAELDALFGGGTTVTGRAATTDEARSELDKLFADSDDDAD